MSPSNRRHCCGRITPKSKILHRTLLLHAIAHLVSEFVDIVEKSWAGAFAGENWVPLLTNTVRDWKSCWEHARSGIKIIMSQRRQVTIRGHQLLLRVYGCMIKEQKISNNSTMRYTRRRKKICVVFDHCKIYKKALIMQTCDLFVFRHATHPHCNWIINFILRSRMITGMFSSPALISSMNRK